MKIISHRRPKVYAASCVSEVWDGAAGAITFAVLRVQIVTGIYEQKLN